VGELIQLSCVFYNNEYTHRLLQVLMEPGQNMELFPKFSKSRSIEVFLNPGQSLYIPPYWLVRSEFMSFSMFLDIYSLSDTEVRLAVAQFTNIPLGNFSTSLKERTIAAQVQHTHYNTVLVDIRNWWW
jgi:hypothetical protein